MKITRRMLVLPSSRYLAGSLKRLPLKYATAGRSSQFYSRELIPIEPGY
jgi:hypothetical protein